MCAATYRDYGSPSAARQNEDGAALYPGATTADQNGDLEACLYSGVVPGEALPLASQVLSGKTTSSPATAVGQDKVAGGFTEHLRQGLHVLGLSVASLAVAGLTAGAPAPAAAFGLLLMLIAGLSTVTIRLSE